MLNKTDCSVFFNVIYTQIYKIAIGKCNNTSALTVLLRFMSGVSIKDSRSKMNDLFDFIEDDYSELPDELKYDDEIEEGYSKVKRIREDIENKKG